jgi:hypothetical protein
MALFTDRARDSVLSRTAVFKVYGQFLDWGSDEDLRLVFAELTRRRVALAAELGMLTATKRCGEGIEGYGEENVGSGGRAHRALRRQPLLHRDG